MPLIYVAMWRNKKRLTKSQMFRFYIILGANLCDTWENPKNELFMKHLKQFFFLIKKKNQKR